MRKIPTYITVGLCLLPSAVMSGQRGQYCEKTNYSAQEIANAIKQSPLRSELKQTSCTIGGLGRFESGGNKGVYNGSCCTGILQVNGGGLAKYGNGMTREEYGCSSLQNQVDVWARLTNAGYSSPAVKSLSKMSTFDGQTVDAAFISSCVQLGAGNCNKMVKSGKCSGFSDINGTTICDMARNARQNAKGCTEGKDANCNPNDLGNPNLPGAVVADNSGGNSQPGSSDTRPSISDTQASASPTDLSSPAEHPPTRDMASIILPVGAAALEPREIPEGIALPQNTL